MCIAPVAEIIEVAEVKHGADLARIEDIYQEIVKDDLATPPETKHRIVKLVDKAFEELDEMCKDCEVVFERSRCDLAPKEINNVLSGTPGAKRKGKVTVDSGAEDSVWPASHVSWHKVKESEDSARGIGFVAANGEKMKNYGSTQVLFHKDGKAKKMNFSVTDCKKPLASVSKIVDKGNRVVFDEDESYIQNKVTGEKIILERERGTYVMVVEFEVEEAPSNPTNPTTGFRRRA